MTASSDDDLEALERARSRLAARLDGAGSLLPMVIRQADPRAQVMDQALRTAVEKIDEALALLRAAPRDPSHPPAPDAQTDTFRTVLRAKSTSSLSALIPTLHPVEARDDLTLINGISDLIARQLAAIGVTRIRQIADWGADDIRHIGHALGLNGAIFQQNWIEQAHGLAAFSPAPSRLEPVMVEAAPAAPGPGGLDMTVGGIGLDDILANIRSMPVAKPVDTRPAPAMAAAMTAYTAAASGEAPESVYGSVKPVPVVPDFQAPKTAVAESSTVPVHEDAAARLAQLETELQSLSKTYPASRTTSLPDDTVILRPPTLRDRLGGLPAATAAPEPATAEVEEAEVMIVTSSRPRVATVTPSSARGPARLAPPAPPALALVQVNREQQTASSEPPVGNLDVDEATVVIVRQPKAAQLIPELPFFQAAKQPVEERSVQRFLKALHGE
jgi:predicted flap endonuclease-1-like 5' DNA nuclease